MSGTATARRRFTLAEYVSLEKASSEKHELVDGQIFAMSGGTPEHGRIAARIIGILHAQLAGRPCAPFTSDVRIRVRATGLVTYPDVSIVCGPVEVDPEDPNSIVNPTVIFEVLSTSTAAYDREDKFAHYRRIPSLKAYVLVSQQEHRFEVFTRVDDVSWNLRDVRDGTAVVEAISLSFVLEEVYANPLGS